MNEFISAHLRWCRNRNHAARSIEERRRCLEQADRQLPFGLMQANEEDIREWLDNDRWRPATKAAYWGHLREAFRWANRGRTPLLDWDPMEEIDCPSRPGRSARPVDVELANRLLAELPEPWNTYVLLARAQGLRCCEIAALHSDHIGPKLTELHGAKGGQVQHTPTHPAVWQRVRLLSGMIAEAVGGRADAHWISVTAARYFRTHGIDASMHRFRHLFACELRRGGADLFKVKDAMRHKSITSTQIYVEVGNEELHLAVTSLPIPTQTPS